MRASARLLAAVALVATVACDALDAPAPVPTAVEPARGWAGDRTAIVVRGSGFAVRTARPASGGAVAVDDAHRAWLGETALEDVVRVDAETLRATVPAGLPAGRHPLVLENPFGARGRLEDAFEVVATGAALSVALAADAASLTVGQGFAVRATIANPGTAPAQDVRAVLVATSADGGAAALSGPTPPTVASLAAGEEVELAWSGVATAAGEVSLALSVTATDELSGQALEGAAPAQRVAVGLPAGLVATIAAARSTVSAGQAVEATFTLTNGGAAAAAVTAVTPSWEPGPGTTCTPPSPPPPVAVPSGGAVTLGWSCTSAVPGELRLSATAEGEDANSGAPITAAAIPATVLVEAPAALAAVLALPAGSATASVGQPLALTLVVSNVGGAAAEVLEATPTVAPPSAAACGAPAPALPRDLPGGGSLELGWTCTPAVPGAVTFGAHVAGRDANSGAALDAAPPGATATVQLPAALAGVVQATRSVANVGQPVGVTFTVTNGGAATAIVRAVTPSSSGVAPATCEPPAPSPPQSIPSGAAVAFSWTCTATAPGALALSATAEGEDANSGAALAATPAAPAAVEVQAPAELSAAIALPPEAATVSVGQAIPLTLTVANSGGAAADVVAIDPTIAPPGAAACGPASPSPPRVVGGGASAEFRWSCTPASPGVVTFGAAVEGRDRNTLAPLAASTAAGATAVVEPPAALAAVVAAAPPAVNAGQPVTVTFTVTNGEGAIANLLAVEPAASGIPGASCGDPSPPLPPSLAPGEALALAWTCVAPEAGTLALSGTVTGSDANSGAAIVATPSAPATVLVEEPAALSAALSLATGSEPVPVGGALAVTLALSNDGGADAEVTAVELTVEEGEAECGAPDPPAPFVLLGGAGADVSWTCTPLAPGTLAFGASAAGRDVHTLAALGAVADPVATTAVPLPPVDVAYSPNPAVYVAGTAIEPNVPSHGGGAVDAWSVDPPLPAGLTLDAATGAVSGTPLAAAEAAAYLVTATNAGGSATVALELAVIAPAALEATLSAEPASPRVGEGVAVTLAIVNAGGADATIEAVSLVVASGGLACGEEPTPAPPRPAAAGGPGVAFTWSCSALAAGNAVLHATATADAAEVAPAHLVLDVQP